MIRSLIAAFLLLTVFSSKCSGQLSGNYSGPATAPAVGPVVVPPNPVYSSEAGCEGSATALSCAKPGLVDKVIQVVSATYGRTSHTVCKHFVPKNNLNTHCVPTPSRTKTNTGYVQELCDSRKSCIVHASSYIFGDTCVGTYKYVIVKYKCVAADCKNILSQNYCDGWAAKGECFNNPGWFYPRCQKSCTKDCNTDCKNIGHSDQVCDRRALEGQCTKSSTNKIDEKRMHAICPLSCKACPPRSQVCTNTKSDCGLRAARGDCQDDHARLQMYQECRKACGACPRTC